MTADDWRELAETSQQVGTVTAIIALPLWLLSLSAFLAGDGWGAIGAVVAALLLWVANDSFAQADWNNTQAALAEVER